MLLLTIDTSGKFGAVAICRGDDAEVRVLATESLDHRQYSAQLIPKLAEMLHQLRLSKGDLEAIAVVSGPGSFTGLRVGLAAAKGLAEVLNKPLAALSAFEAIAASSRSYNPESQSRVVAALDAGRKEAYVAGCELLPGYEVRILEPELVKQADLCAAVARHSEGSTVVTPDDSLSPVLAGGAKCECIQWPSAKTLAQLALSHFRRGLAVSAADLDADYIRRSDAEIFSAPFL